MIRYANDAPRTRALDAALDGLEGPPELCLVLGGDGTMLRAIARHGPDYTYFGVNCGHLGFLMNDVAGGPLPNEANGAAQVAAAVERIVREGTWTAVEFPRLRMIATRADGEFEALALNDVYVERQAQTCHLRVTVDGVEVVRHMVADGIVAATPLGSTAYSFSAGGPAAHPFVQAIHLTAICPHIPRLAPLVLPPTARIRIEVLDPDERSARAVADGVPCEDVRRVDIFSSGDTVRLGYLHGHDFTATMIRKILHP
ncbi:MAG: NAD(+)/NADH kinase [Pseudomonadota bacterium]|nr:NAD(+)/NADH kinase [Pseudomonadota bacterium]